MESVPNLYSYLSEYNNFGFYKVKETTRRISNTKIKLNDCEKLFQTILMKHMS